MWFKNLSIFKVALTSAAIQNLNQSLEKHRFAPCLPSQAESVGFAPPREHGNIAHVVGGQILLCIQCEKKTVPSKVVERELKKKCAEIAQQQGYAPGRKARKELNERIIDELLTRAFAVPGQLRVWIDPVNGFLCIDTSSPTAADRAIKLLLKAVDGLTMEGITVGNTPSECMKMWLGNEEAPQGFTIDQDAKFVSEGEDKATVKFSNHPLDYLTTRDLMGRKDCVELALTWRDKISLVLTGNLIIKRIKPLSLLQESDQKGENADERFDGDLTLMAGELSALIGDLGEALGGFANFGQKY